MLPVGQFRSSVCNLARVIMASYDHLKCFGQRLLLTNFGELIFLCSVPHLCFQTSVHTNNALNTKLSDNHYKCIIWFNIPKSS